MNTHSFDVHEYLSEVGTSQLLRVDNRRLMRVSDYDEYHALIQHLPHARFDQVFYATHQGQTGVYISDDRRKTDGLAVFRSGVSPNKYDNKLATTIAIRIFGCSQLDLLQHYWTVLLKFFLDNAPRKVTKGIAGVAFVDRSMEATEVVDGVVLPKNAIDCYHRFEVIVDDQAVAAKVKKTLFALLKIPLERDGVKSQFVQELHMTLIDSRTHSESGTRQKYSGWRLI